MIHVMPFCVRHHQLIRNSFFATRLLWVLMLPLIPSVTRRTWVTSVYFVRESVLCYCHREQVWPACTHETGPWWLAWITSGWVRVIIFSMISWRPSPTRSTGPTSRQAVRHAWLSGCYFRRLSVNTPALWCFCTRRPEEAISHRPCYYFCCKWCISHICLIEPCHVSASRAKISRVPFPKICYFLQFACQLFVMHARSKHLVDKYSLLWS